MELALVVNSALGSCQLILKRLTEIKSERIPTDLRKITYRQKGKKVCSRQVKKWSSAKKC